MRRLLALIACLLAAAPAWGAPCVQPDLETRVTGGQECLIVKTYRHEAGLAEGGTLYLLLHGNHSNGSPAVSMYRVAEELAKAGPPGSIAAALIRPGYNDDQGEVSSGDAKGRADNFTADVADQIADALGRLKTHHKALRAVLIGHSGGAALAGVLLGRHPGLAQAALLVACPCDVKAWRQQRGRIEPPWQSESPSDYVARYPPKARVALLVAKDDSTTPPALSQAFARQLSQLGIAVDLRIPDSGGHIEIVRSRQVIQMALELVR
jgi:pimeloyl-ACP methyl ester carboxylesterase